MPSRSLALRALVALTTVAVVAGNFLAEALPFAGRSTAEVSALYPVLVTPAGYVFAIWGLIYLGMLAYSVAQFVPPLRHDPLPDTLAAPLIVSNVANVSWLLLWHSLLISLTFVVMLVILGSLIVAYVLARRDRPERVAPLERWAVRAPLSLYLGWISVATIANTSILLYSLGWRGAPLSEEAWSVIALAAGALVAVAALLRQRDGIFVAVFVWAYAGIAVAHASSRSVSAVAQALAVGLGVAAAVFLTDRRHLRWSGSRPA